jgi:hypothetical protein
MVWVTDDMVPNKPMNDGVRTNREGGRKGPQLGVTWSKFRGAGAVKFANASPAIENGRATTEATFAEPGNYVLRVLAWDDTGPQGPVMATGFFCCWTNGYVDVTVASADKKSR